MNERIRAHIEGLFENAPKSNKFTELKEELLSNCNCKYDDLVAGGTPPDDAYKQVIAGIGDVSELISQLQTGQSADAELIEKGRVRSALLVSVSVGLFILSPAVYMFISYLLHRDEFAILAMFGCIAAGVGLLIYNSMTKVRYQKTDDTMIEEFREWKVQNEQSKNFRGLISSVLWPLILITYFLISFFSGAWHITWVLFIVGVLIEGIIGIIFELRKGKNK